MKKLTIYLLPLLMAVMMVGCSSDDDNFVYDPSVTNTLQIRDGEKTVSYLVTDGTFYDNQMLISVGPSFIFNCGLPEESGLSGMVIRIAKTSTNELEVGETFQMNQFGANLTPRSEWYCGTAFVNNTRLTNGTIQVVDKKTKDGQDVLTLRLINVTFGEGESSIVINGTVNFKYTGSMY